MQRITNPAREAVADAFQALADTDTLFRLENAPAVGRLVEQAEPDWAVARAALGLVITDATDGFWARTAKQVRGYDKPTLGAAEDPKADHLTIDSFMQGLIHRSLRNGDMFTARELSSLRLRATERDQRMDANRQRIRENPHIDKRELRASVPNKLKMVAQVAGSLTLISPLHEKPKAKRAGLGLLRLGVWLGEIGERSFSSKVDQLENERPRTANNISPIHRQRSRR